MRNHFSSLGLAGSWEEVPVLPLTCVCSEMGMGRYQWYLFFLCGFGYFLDLCWAQAFGLVSSAIQQELGIPSEHSPYSGYAELSRSSVRT